MQIWIHEYIIHGANWWFIRSPVSISCLKTTYIQDALFKGIVRPEMKMCRKCAPSQAIKIQMSLFLHQIWRNVALHHLQCYIFKFLTSQDINWWTGVEWIIVMFLSAVWTLILTAPIHCRASIAETVMQCYISPNLTRNKTHLHLGWSWGWAHFQPNFHYGATIPLTDKLSAFYT